VVTTIAAKIYLQEQVSSLRWSGVCLIMLGAALITWTEKHKAVPEPGSDRADQPAARS
jgi:drug/metabolite transporter (DMT)-like permease